MKTDRNKGTAVSFLKYTFVVGGKKLPAFTQRREIHCPLILLVLMPRENQDWLGSFSSASGKAWEDTIMDEA